MKKQMTLAAALLAAAFSHAEFKDFLNTVGNPLRGESSPVLWYQTSGSKNSGSAGEIYTLTNDGDISQTGPGFWESSSAFGLADSATLGAAVPNSESFASGDNGTVCFLVRTPETMSGFDSLFNAGDYGAPSSNLELGIKNGALRLSTRTGGAKANIKIADLNAGTWYYFAVTWDTSLPSDNLTYYCGEAGKTLLTGIKTIDSAGAPNKLIYVGGRSYAGYAFNGGYFQSVAVYSETLSAESIHNQFNALSTP